MSLVFQNVTTGTASGSKTTASTGKAATTTVNGTTGADTFDQSLAQMMTGEGNAAMTANLLSTGSLLAGLLQNVSDETESTSLVQGLTELINSMLKEADQLDDAITANPSLIASLQSWLQQVTAVLNGNGNWAQDSSASSSDVESSPAMSQLAEHPATLRFAVQDGLAQLLSALQSSTSKDLPANALQLLGSFQNLMLQNTTGSSSKSDSSEASSFAPESLPTVATTKLGAISSSELKRLTALLESVNSNDNKNNTSVDTRIQTLLSKATSMNNTTLSSFRDLSSVEKAANEEVSTVNSDDLINGQTTITAGQLVMKEGIQSPFKAATVPTVPVDKFAKEMTSFVINKLDIVKQQGITEAKISLYPEHLGQVDIKITMQNGQLIAQFTAEHAGTKDLLEQQMSQLRSSLQSQGLQVEKLVVTQNQSLQSQMYHDGRQPGSGQQQQSNRRSKDKDTASEDALIVSEIADELSEWMASQEQEQSGNSFTAKA